MTRLIDAMFDINHMPTVDAIPISWIKDWWYKNRFAVVEIGDMLEAWESHLNDHQG